MNKVNQIGKKILSVSGRTKGVLLSSQQSNRALFSPKSEYIIISPTW